MMLRGSNDADITRKGRRGGGKRSGDDYSKNPNFQKRRRTSSRNLIDALGRGREERG